MESEVSRNPERELLVLERLSFKCLSASVSSLPLPAKVLSNSYAILVLPDGTTPASSIFCKCVRALVPALVTALVIASILSFRLLISS